MKLKEALEAHGRAPGTVCTVRRILEAMPDKDADEWREALHPDSGYSGAQIARTLSDPDGPYRIKAQSVTRHRAGECSCDGR